MTDKYIDFVSSGLGKKLSAQLGLPQPVTLRRHSAKAPLVPGPVRVISPDADDLAALLASWGVTVAGELAEGERWGAVIVDLTAIAHPRDLSDPVLALGSTLRKLAKCGRVVTISVEATISLTRSPAP